jgi:hypothetical protein
MRPLSEVQLAAIELLVQGHTDPSVASHLGVHRQTVFNWRHYNPAFRAELARRRAQVWGAASELFRAGLGRAIQTLQEQSCDVYAPTAFRAARAIVALADRFAPPDEPIDVEGVLNLEALKLKAQRLEQEAGKSPVSEEERKEALDVLMQQAGEDFTNAAPQDASAPASRNEDSNA